MASLISAGTATNTAVSITGDTTGALALATNNGVTAVTIDTSQRVGIGVTSPAKPLSVYGADGYIQMLNASTGTANGDGAFIGVEGGTTALRIVNQENDAMSFHTNGLANERMRIDSSGNVGIGTTSPSTRLSLQLSSATTYTTSTRTNQGLTIYNSSATTNGFTGIEFVGEPTSGNGGFAGIGSVVTGSGSANLVFGTRDSATYAERMRIDSSGNLLVGTTSATIGGVTLYSNSFGLRGDYSASYASSISSSSTTGTQYFFNFARNTSPCGSISSTGSNSTTYATSSDYRLKENIHPMTGALEIVSQLKPVTYKWKENGSDGHGFIAHELQAIVPECVVGEKDAVDANGNPVYQGVDTSFLVATLTAAIQELKQINDTQAETINALKARLDAAGL